MTKKFTDNLLATLYLKISSRYRELSEDKLHPNTQEIYWSMVHELNYELNSPVSRLHELAEEEKFKVFAVLNTFFTSLNSYPSQVPFNYVFAPQPIIIHESRWHHHSCYCPHNDVLFTWLMLDSISHRHGRWSGVSNHHRHSSKKKEDLVLILLVVAMVIAVAAAFVAAYYLLRELLDNLERISFNEGWLQAVVNLSSAIGSMAVTGLFASLFASAPLAAFALAAGITNPVGVVVLGVICLSLLGGALGCFITNQIQNYVIKEANKDALDPLDPHRYGLTLEQEQHLIRNNFDLIKVKCAIVALHEQIGKEMPPRLHRIFSDSDGKQALLDKIRNLRSGQAGYLITVGTGANQLHFNLRLPSIPVQPVEEINPSVNSSEGYHDYPEPSAPPAYD
ncbi:hypothetical protein [Legionella clemsonensis]|uniref:Uncharacterized protein n=1 Tax=Legionella clemsonensis TaxID=1867846 RepID=A0A222P4R1_9GAMM|nr:hypothetical protein [Legionella clemsonensis]ASQ46812.1 hypothetical protein clem_11345 [Legionella clemsonensis]